jgi:diguanylate cyclase (GGDEF)-like protein
MPLSAVEALQLTLVVVSLVFAGACYLGWRLFDHPRHALIWSLAFVLAALQYTFNLLREFSPSYEWWWVSVNTLSCLLVLTAAVGHRNRLGLSSSPLALVTIAGTLLLAQVLFTLLVPRMDVRVALAPGFACLALCHVAWILLRHGPEPRLAQQVAAVVNLLFALAQGLAALIALQFGTEATQEQRDLYNLVNFALMPTFFVAMGVTVIFLLATDLATRLRQQAVTDSLTGMSNRRGFMQLAGRLFGLARRQDQPLTLVLADLDFFKRINDRYGHSVGDRTLVHFARTLARCLRSEEVSARIGGEEFAVLLAGEEADACTLIDRLREAMRAHPLEEGGSRILLTASFGVAQRSGEESVETLLMRADEALYRAKGAGRDTLVIAPGPAPPRMVSRA